MTRRRDIYDEPLTRRSHIAIGNADPHFDGLGLKRLGILRTSELTISSGVVTATTGHHSIDTEGDAANDDLDTINGLDSGDFLYLVPANDSRTIRIRSGVGNIYSKHQIDSRALSFVSPSGAGAHVGYMGTTYYEWATADANLDQGGASIVLGTANVSYAAHASIVAGGVGVVASGTVRLTASGTLIDDEGNRTTSQTVEMASDITALALNQYIETSEKFLGQVTFALEVTSGSPATYSLDFNYGYSKYEDFGNQDFTITLIEIVGEAGATDTGFNIRVFHHNAADWHYAASGFTPGPNAGDASELANMNTDHGTEQNLASDHHFAWKRVDLNTDILGDDGEGLVIEVSTSSAKAVEYLTGTIGVHTAPKFIYMATTKQHLVFMNHFGSWLEL